MKFKKILSAVISTAMCFSIFATNVTASNDLPASNSIEIVCENSNGSQSILNQFENEYRYEDIADISSLNYIPVDTSNYGIMTCSDNSAPIAGLTYAVANPESIVNGSFTTDTIIYWLWNDGTTAYTYDPDGDDITNILIDGVYDYILGNVTIGDEVVGFATQITEAAEHELFYQVVDSNGNYSNVVYYTFEIEPADGNTRPICIASPSNSDFFINTPVTINWGNSYDSDDGDTIAGVRVRVYRNGYYELITTNSDYYVSMTNTSMNLVFDEIGAYEIWVSLSDNHNAWSNWCIFSIETNDPDSIIMLNCPEWSDTERVSWSENNSTAYHTLTSRLSEVYVYEYNYISLNSYTNHNGTYNNVIAYVVAPNTLFMSAEVWNSDSTGYVQNYTDPYFNESTPRRLTLTEINTLVADEQLVYVVYNPSTNTIIDFLCVLNPLIAYGWNTPEIN